MNRGTAGRAIVGALFGYSQSKNGLSNTPISHTNKGPFKLFAMPRLTTDIDNGAGRRLSSRGGRSTGGHSSKRQHDQDEVPKHPRKQVAPRGAQKQVLATGRYIHVCASHLYGVRLDVQKGPIVEESIFG